MGKQPCSCTRTYKKITLVKLLMMILKDIPVAAIKTGSIQMKINQENLK